MLLPQILSSCASSDGEVRSASKKFYAAVACPQCGDSFAPSRVGHLYCSTACRVLAAYHREPRFCGCGKVIEPSQVRKHSCVSCENEKFEKKHRHHFLGKLDGRFEVPWSSHA